MIWNMPLMAAALTFSACSSEDNLAEETKIEKPTAQTVATIHVTVVGEGPP